MKTQLFQECVFYNTCYLTKGILKKLSLKSYQITEYPKFKKMN